MAQPLFYNPDMTIAQLLVTMCSDLADADLNAIRKARGFSARETASRESFASFFVSSIGVQEAMRRLTTEESITLHMLQQVGEVDITFFERLYGSSGRSEKYYHGTYTQQFRPTFDAVKKNLVRNGLLIMAEVKQRGESVQMERWRFALPPEFAPYLPPILQPKLRDQPGETSDHAIRKKLLQLVGGASAVANDPVPIHIENGSIQLGKHSFTVSKLIEWQSLAWKNVSRGITTDAEASVHPVDAIRTLIKDLNPGEWVDAKSFEPALKIFCFGSKTPPTVKILQQGWELGVLSRLQINGDVCYRLASGFQRSNSDPLPPAIPWLRISPKADAATVDLRLVPFYQLELLNALVNMVVENGVLRARPDLIRLSRALPTQRQSPLSNWLSENIPAYREALAAVNERWGKTLLHKNLLVARVRDLSLRIQLERELGQKIIVLGQNYIAFPIESRSSVERVLKKSGFVVKTVKP